MSRFVEDRSWEKKKKKKETAQKTQSPSVSKKQVEKVANNVVSNTAQTATKSTGMVTESIRRQNNAPSGGGGGSTPAPSSSAARTSRSGSQTPTTSRDIGTSGGQYSRAGTSARQQASPTTQKRMAEIKKRDEERKKKVEERRIAAQKQKLTGGIDNSPEAKKEREDRLREAQRQKMGYNSMASEETQQAANRAIKNTPAVIKKSALDIKSGHTKTIADLTAMTANNKNGNKALAMKMGIQDDADQVRKLEASRRRTVAQAKQIYKEESEKADKRQAEWDKRSQGAKGLEKAYYGALESGVGMVSDQLLGPAWAASMLSRTYGNTRGQAQKEGATEAEDRAYSLLQGVKEVATEYLFAGVGLARGLSGKHSLSFADKAAKAATKNMTGRLADVTNAGIRVLGGTLEENAEEAIAWGADPIIKEITYGKNVRKRQAQEVLKDQSNQLRSQIGSEEQARAMSAYLGSNDFIEQNKRTYIDSGIGEAEAEDLAYKMRDYLTASLSGDTETMERLEKQLTDQISGKVNLADEYKKSLSELMDTFAATTLLTATTGIPGAAISASRGSAYRDALGSEGVRALANTAIDFEDKQMSLKAQVMRDRMDAGKEITATQAYDLAQGVAEQYRKDSSRQQASELTARRRMQDERLVDPIVRDRSGRIVGVDEITDKEYESTAKEAKKVLKSFVDSEDSETKSITEKDADRGSRAIAGFKTGVFTVDDANELNYRNTAVRSTFKAMTGIDLDAYIVRGKDGEVDIPATNAKTKDALFALASDNLVASAAAETANWMDVAKGQTVTQISQRMGAKGSAALQSVLDGVDARDRDTYMMTANASDMLYQAGRNMGTEWETAKDYAVRMFPDIPESQLKSMYDAGLADRDMAMDTARGKQVAIGEALTSIDGPAVAAPTGQVTVDPDVSLKGSDYETFTGMAQSLGIDIHFVSNFRDKDGKALHNQNGSYDPETGTITLATNAKFEKNVGYIFMHECTHHLRTFAPEQYQALEDLVREKWFGYDATQMQNEISKKIEAYAKHGKTLTEDQALEEIIADAAHEFINDSNFAKTAAETDPSLAQAILESIRSALRAIRRMLSLSNPDDETHMNTLFSQLDILDEAERLWLSAYKQAVANRAAVGIEDLQNRIYEEGKQAASVNESESTYTVDNMPDMDELDQTNTTIENENGDPVAHFQEDGAIMLSVSSFEDSGREIYENYLKKMVKNKEFTQKEADDMMREFETVYKICKDFADSERFAPFTAWSNANVIYDDNGKPVFSAIKQNSEYKMNIDFSTICKKRRTLDAVFREMINRGMFEQLDLNKDESAAMVVNINNLIRQHKFEAACALCFVEARRYRQQQTAKTFTDMWNGIVESMYKDKNKIAYFNFGEDSTVEDVADGIHTMSDADLDLTYVRELATAKSDKGGLKQTAEAKAARLILKDPSQRKLMRVGDMMASTGFENMQINDPDLMKIYNAKKGTGGAKSSFGDVQYLNEILKPRSFSRLKAYAVSGVRIQSFSDYVPRMVFDYVQVIADLAAKKLPAHAYTKEVLFARQFGLTGAKINLSLVPDVVADGTAPGLDKDGNYIWNEEGTFPYDEAMKLQEAEGYKENCGTIAVGISDEQIMKMLADPTIQMVIPYHKSSLNPIVAAMTNVDRFTNYEDFQRTKGADGKALDKDFPWDDKLFRLTHTAKGKLLPKEEWGNVQDIVNEYVEWCEKKSYTPKFSQFLYKRKDDKIDGEIVLDADGNKVINPGYYKLLEDFALLDNDGNFKPQGDVQMRFPTESDAFGSMKDLIEQGLTEDTELEEKRSSEISGIVDEIQDMFEQGTLTEQSATSEKLSARMSISEDLDEPYMQAVESGNMEEAQRLVDEAAKRAGFGTRLYHGTQNFGFTQIRTSELESNSDGGFYEWSPFFATDSLEVAQTYSSSDDVRQISEAPAPFDEEQFAKDFNDSVYNIISDINRFVGVYNYMDYEGNPFSEAFEKTVDEPGLIEEITEELTENMVEIISDAAWAKANDSFDERPDNDMDVSDYADWLSEEPEADEIWGSFYEATNLLKSYAANYFGEADSGNYELFANTDNVMQIDAKGSKWNTIPASALTDVTGEEQSMVDYVNTRTAAAYARDHGYDGIQISNLFDDGGHGRRQKNPATIYIFFKPESQVKSADTVTYAEDGSVIPLSERFDPNNNDIRYSMSTVDSDGDVLTDGQMEYFRNSQARDADGRLVKVYHTTNSGGFTIFDPQYSDDKRSLFFSSNWDVSQTYGDYGSNQRVEFAEPEDIRNAEDFPFIYQDVINKGYYEVYLNLENPLIVDAKGHNWNDIPYGSEANLEAQTIYKFNELYITFGQHNKEGEPTKLFLEINGEKKNVDHYEKYEVLKQFGLPDVISEADRMFNNERGMLLDQLEKYWRDELGLSPMGLMTILNEESDFYGDIIYKDKAPLRLDLLGERLYETEDETYRTRELAEIAQSEGHDGVIVRNCRDIGGASYLAKGSNPISDIYIAFSSNQVKDTRNENPTENPDIRYSFTDEEEDKSDKDYRHAQDDSYELLEYYESMISDEELQAEFVDATDETFNMEYFMKMLRAYGKADKKARKTGKASNVKLDNTEDALQAFYDSLTEEVGMVYDDDYLEEGRIRMANSKRDFYSNINAKWNERWVSGGEVLDIKSVKGDVKNLIMGVMNNSNTDRQYKKDLVNKTLIDIRTAYQMMKQGRTELASALLYHSALRMISDVEFIVDDTEYQNYKDLRNFLRNTKISFSEKYWNDVDFAAYRKRNFGKIKLVKGPNDIDKGTYDELVRAFPEYFGEAAMADNGLYKMGVPEMMEQIDYVLNLDVQPFMEAYSSEDCAKWAFDIADDLYEIMVNGDRIVSTADRYKEKYDAQAKAMKTRHAEALLRIRKAKEEGIEAERIKFREYKEQQKEKKYHSKYFDSIVKSHKTLTERLLTNTKDKHIPQQYKRQLAELLRAFDLQTVASKKVEARRGVPGQKKIKMSALKTTLTNMAANTQFFYINDTITDIMDELLGINADGAYSRSIDGLTIDELNSEELKKIDKMLKALIHEFNNYESVRVGAKRQQAEDIGTAQVDSCLEHVDKFGEGKDWNNFLGAMDKILNLDEVTPAYMFRMIDRENKGLGLMFKELRRSFGKYVRNQEKLNNWMEEIIGEYHNKGKLWNKYGADTIDDWRRSKAAKEFQLQNGSVTLTPAQMMSIYCLSKRKQAYDHMTGAGIVAMPVSFQAKMETDLKRKANYALPVILTDSDIKLITSNLTPEQIKVADKLQQLMANQMAEWGNEASMSVLGIELFEDPDYFPIKSDKAALEKDFSADQFAECIRNFGFTKAVQPGARNAIAVGDIFDIVAEHCNQMNLYNSYSESMNDFMKVYNFHAMREDGSDYSVEQAVAHAYSKKATTFISDFMKDLNGNGSRDRTTGIEAMMNDTLGKAKKASVFANGRVALQQPTAIMRAFYVIDPKYLKGVSVSKATMQEMFEHSPIAQWKSWGYYDINMGKSIEDIMMNNGKWLEDKMTDLYGQLDNRTWTAIWGMCKAEIEDTHKDVEKGSDEYWELVSERMDEVVDLTQVVDSPFHRSHAMRSKNTLVKMATAFMAEPTLTFNMVRDGFIRSKEQLRLGNKGKASKIAGRTLFVFGLSAFTTAAMAAIWDAVRGKGGDDDDEDQSAFDLWWSNCLENLKDNLNLLNNIYYVKDVVSIFQGWDQRNLGLQGFKHIADSLGQLTGSRNVKSKLSWWENAVAGIGYLTGMPFKTIMNDGKAILNMFGLHPTVLSMVGEYLDSMQDMMSGSASESGAKISSNNKKNEVKSTGELTDPKGATVKLWTYDDAPFHVEDGSLADNFLNRFGVNLTAAEIKQIEESEAEKAKEKKIEDIRAKVEENGLTGLAKDKKVWSYVTTYAKEQNGEKPMSEFIQEGDFGTVKEIKAMYIKAGGDPEYFNQRVFDTAKSAMKKTISADNTDAQKEAQTQIKNYLLENGMSEAELSDLAYNSITTRDLKAAIMINDPDAAVKELRALIDAGLTEEDFYRIWDNRRRFDIKKYKTYGKYADRFKSTGTYQWAIRGQITSGFGHRSSPGGIGSTNHQGIDIAGNSGDPVAASDGGVVIMAQWYGGAGKTVQIQHDDGTITQYSHLSWWDANVGDTVAQGQVIGKVGSTGNSTGPHLHFGVIKDGHYVDPMKYLH